MNRTAMLYRALMALLFLSPAGLSAQAPGTMSSGRLEITSTSDAAKTEFWSGIWNSRNAHVARAVVQLERALSLDPEFGLARIFLGQLKPGLTPAERQNEFARGLSSLSKASAPELLLGLALREQSSGRQPIALPVMQAAHQLLPADREIGFRYYALRNFGRTPAEVAANYREGSREYADVSNFHQTLGYNQFTAGDRAAGIAAMREYVRLEPKHPNSHESLAELLHRDGKNDEAVATVQRAIAADSTFGSSFGLLAYIRLDAGDVPGARSYWSKALQVVLNAVDSVDFMHSSALGGSLFAGDTRTAMTRLGEAAALAESRRLTAPAVLIHQRMALIDALYGDGRGAEAHLTKAGQLGATNTANQHIHSSLAYAASGKPDLARAAAEKFSVVATDANRRVRHTLDGFIALQANDPTRAVTELTQADSTDVLAKELLAEAHLKQGRRAEAQALRAQVNKTPVFVQGQARGADLFVMVARLRAKAG